MAAATLAVVIPGLTIALAIYSANAFPRAMFPALEAERCYEVLVTTAACADVVDPPDGGTGRAAAEATNLVGV